MSRAPTISATAVVLALRAAGLEGPAAASALHAVGIPAAVLDDPEAEVPFASHAALLEHLAGVVGDPSFGLRAGLGAAPAELGAVGYVLTMSRDVEAAVGNLVRFFAIHQEGADLFVADDGEVQRLGYRVRDPAIAPRRQDAEHTIGLAVAAFRVLLGPDWRPEAVWFEHAAHADVSTPRALLGVTPSHGRPYNAIAFPRALLAHPLPSHDPSLLNILERHAAGLLAERSHADSWAAKVRAEIALRLRDGAPSAAEVGRALGASASTLGRRLREEKTSFAAELTAVRRALAERYLSDPTLSLTEIAFLLGFSEASAFTRAFGRWTQTTPKAFRRAALARR
ncbi:MAG: AraC family transcriptional regulator [Sandaracinaceae bacterium]|nr:AraC family transcriptional regulator [Sandaracinaceae bacterium]